MKYRAIAVIAACVVFAGCFSKADNRWQPQAESKPGAVAEKPSAKRIVLFAPTALGPLHAIYAQARLDYPFDLADRVDVLMRDADGRVGENLPNSDDPAWDKGRVALTAGAHVIVLTMITDLQKSEGASSPRGRLDHFTATARMRCLDVNGMELVSKTATGAADAEESAKFMGESNRPESRACWNAIANTLGTLRSFLDQQGDMPNQPKRASSEQAPAPAALIEVVIGSQPDHADIVVDGLFRGTTPQKLPLPQRPVKIRLERAGFKPWERELTPAPDLKVEPVLEALAPASPAGP